MVIESQMYLESDCIDFQIFVFLAVIDPYLYNTDIKVQQVVL